MSSSSAKDRKHSYADLGPRMVSDMSSEIPLSGTEERRGQTLFPITSNFATRVLPPLGTIPNKPDEMYSSKLRIGTVCNARQLLNFNWGLGTHKVLFSSWKRVMIVGTTTEHGAVGYKSDSYVVVDINDKSKPPHQFVVSPFLHEINVAQRPLEQPEVNQILRNIVRAGEVYAWIQSAFPVNGEIVKARIWHKGVVVRGVIQIFSGPYQGQNLDHLAVEGVLPFNSATADALVACGFFVWGKNVNDFMSVVILRSSQGKQAQQGTMDQTVYVRDMMLSK